MQKPLPLSLCLRHILTPSPKPSHVFENNVFCRLEVCLWGRPSVVRYHTRRTAPRGGKRPSSKIKIPIDIALTACYNASG